MPPLFVLFYFMESEYFDFFFTYNACGRKNMCQMSIFDILKSYKSPIKTYYAIYDNQALLDYKRVF